MGNQPPNLPKANDLKHPISKVDLTSFDADEACSYSQIPSQLDKEDPNTISVLCISDTHSLERKMPNPRLPKADILVHAGDFSNVGKKKEVKEFVKWLEEHLDRGDFKQIIVIAGNHDTTFQPDWFHQDGGGNRFFSKKNKIDCEAIRQIVLQSKLIYLEDETADILGVKIYGSPWQPAFCNWAFNLPRGEPLQKIWAKIPESTDILITHGPPAFHGDKVAMGNKDNVGCLDLLHRVQAIKPQFHVFGHIHEGYGVTQQNKLSTMFINASTCNLTYRPDHPPIMFHIRGDRDATLTVPERQKNEEANADT